MGKSIVITGAGSGLGRALARKLSGNGDTLFLMGRNAAKLDKVAQELSAAHVVVRDVADPRSVAEAFAQVGKHAPRLAVLINDAGLFQPSMIAAASDANI